MSATLPSIIIDNRQSTIDNHKLETQNQSWLADIHLAVGSAILGIMGPALLVMHASNTLLIFPMALMVFVGAFHRDLDRRYGRDLDYEDWSSSEGGRYSSHDDSYHHHASHQPGRHNRDRGGRDPLADASPWANPDSDTESFGAGPHHPARPNYSGLRSRGHFPESEYSDTESLGAGPRRPARHNYGRDPRAGGPGLRDRGRFPESDYSDSERFAADLDDTHGYGDPWGNSGPSAMPRRGEYPDEFQGRRGYDSFRSHFPDDDYTSEGWSDDGADSPFNPRGGQRYNDARGHPRGDPRGRERARDIEQPRRDRYSRDDRRELSRSQLAEMYHLLGLPLSILAEYTVAGHIFTHRGDSEVFVDLEFYNGVSPAIQDRLDAGNIRSLP